MLYNLFFAESRTNRRGPVRTPGSGKSVNGTQKWKTRMYRSTHELQSACTHKLLLLNKREVNLNPKLVLKDYPCFRELLQTFGTRWSYIGIKCQNPNSTGIWFFTFSDLYQCNSVMLGKITQWGRSTANKSWLSTSTWAVNSATKHLAVLFPVHPSFLSSACIKPYHPPLQRKQTPLDRCSNGCLQTGLTNLNFPTLIYIKKGGDHSSI